MSKLIKLIFISALLTSIITVNVSAAVTDTYVYNKDGETEPAPSPAQLTYSIRGEDLGIGSFNEPQDLCFSASGKLYIADTKNNRIVIINGVGEPTQNVKIVNSFVNNGNVDTFNSPSGIFVDDNENLFISDTNNARIIKLSAQGDLLQIVYSPENEILQEDFVFKPTKLVVDAYNQIYAISNGYNAGLMEFDPNGTYTQSMGAPQVVKSLIDQFWQSFQTKAQRERTKNYVPTEYSNIAIDDEGFLFVTTATYDGSGDSIPKQLRKLNAKGTDVLNRVGNPSGDTIDSGETYKGNSAFSDVCVLEYGDFAMLDQNRGRVFVYNSVGELLYEFGGPGSISGAIQLGTAVGYYENCYYVLDASKMQITVFELTEYGKLLNAVAKARKEIDFETEKSLWEQILSRNINCTMAMRGLGNAAYKAKNMKLAMEYYKLAGDREEYSKAYAVVRRSWIENNIWIIFAVIVVAGALAFGLSHNKKRIMNFVSQHKNLKAISYSWHCATHPMDGFWCLKRENCGNVISAAVLILLCMLVNVVTSLGTGFIFNLNDLEKYSIFSVLYIVAAVVLWTVCQWCVTTLMNGEGKFKDIYISTCYATLPYTIINIFALLLSKVLLKNEGDFYYVLISLAMVWMIFLLICSVKQTHDFSMGKTFIAIVIILIVILLIIFISMLVLALSQQLFDFISDLISEIALAV